MRIKTMKRYITGGRYGDKTEMMNKLRDEYLKKNPDATIVSFRNGEMIVEKPIKEIKSKLIEKKS